jgi:hypothetical protein
MHTTLGRQRRRIVVHPTEILKAQAQWREAALADGTARPAATAALSGMKAAVTALVSNLREIGYPSVPGVIPPEPGVEERIERLEQTVGAVPPILALFWREVGGLSLLDFDDHAHVGFWEEHGVSSSTYVYPDGVAVEPLDAGWLRFILTDYAGPHEPPGSSPLPEPYVIELAPDYFFKEGYSGGISYGIEVGGGWLATWQVFTWLPGFPVSAPPAPCEFLGYLRTAILECAGFPGLLGLPGFGPLRERLLEGVELF